MKDRFWTYIVIALVVLLVLILVDYLAFGLQPPLQKKNGLANDSIGVISIAAPGSNSLTYGVYLALTPLQQQIGLMNVSSIGNCDGLGNCIGMLFVFQNVSQQCFWMKNTEIPLKQDWITNGTVTSQVNATAYSTVAYCHQGNMVLETATNSSIGLGYQVVANLNVTS